MKKINNSQLYNNKKYNWHMKGIVENLYHLLWMKDPVFGRAPNVKIPQSIIFKSGLPRVWYFMLNGKIKMKNWSSISLKNIIEQFTQQIPPSQIVATFFYQEEFSSQEEQDEQHQIVFQYFNQQQFEQFIMSKKKPNNGNGILQQFIQPKGLHNFVIKAKWTPNFTVMEKRINLKKLNDLNFDQYERVFTYEGQEFHSQVIPVRGYILPNLIEKLCLNIAQHINSVSSETVEVQQLILHLKMNEQNEIFVLYSSYMQIQSVRNIDIQQPPIPKFEKMINHHTSSQELNSENNLFTVVNQKDINLNLGSMFKPFSLQKQFFCYKCQQKFDMQNIFEISYQMIIKAFDRDHFQSQSEIELQQYPMQKQYSNRIPPMMLFIEKELKLQQYLSLKKDINFLSKITTVCQNCFMVITSSLEEGGNEKNAFVIKNGHNYFGQGSLNTKNIQLRTCLTEKQIKINKLSKLLNPNFERSKNFYNPYQFYNTSKFYQNSYMPSQDLKQSLQKFYGGEIEFNNERENESKSTLVKVDKRKIFKVNTSLSDFKILSQKYYQKLNRNIEYTDNKELGLKYYYQMRFVKSKPKQVKKMSSFYSQDTRSSDFSNVNSIPNFNIKKKSITSPKFAQLYSQKFSFETYRPKVIYERKEQNKQQIVKKEQRDENYLKQIYLSTKIKQKQ